jgi:hypothetical protein
MLRNKYDTDLESMGVGVDKLLGKASYGAPTPINYCSEHQSDGFIYDEEPNPVETILRCKICGVHYTAPSSTISLEMLMNKH